MVKSTGVKHKKWEIVEDENIADILVIVYGKTKESLLRNILFAFCSIVTEVEKINLKKEVTFKIKGENFSEQVFLFIEKLIYLKDTKHLIFKKGNFRFKKKLIKATLFGQKLTDLPTKVDIKALTKHKFKLEKKEGYYQLTLVFDV